MTWKIAQAKQNLSKVIREASSEPQQIYNRDRFVAAVIDADTFLHFQAWRRESEKKRPLAEAFQELRNLCYDDDYEFPEIDRQDRDNSFAHFLREEE